MREFDASEIDSDSGEEAEVKTGFCPLIKANCHGALCMWWVRDLHEAKSQVQANCAVALIATGINDESLYRLAGGQRED